MLKKSLAIELFKAFSIQRWNERARPVELVEMDKTAHKMIIAWCLGRMEEDHGRTVDWQRLIKGGIFELLRRITISDIKSPIFRRIREEHPEVFRRLNEWVMRQMDPHLEDAGLREEFREYLLSDRYLDPLTRQVLDAAHHYASYCELQVVRAANPGGYQMEDIQRELLERMEPFLDLRGMRKLITRQKLADFVDLCGQLRFQIRWGQTPRIPRTSVLGHMMLVACFSFFLTRELNACDRRQYNNFFGALFHDLPEAVTRDIISPVKRSVPEMEQIIGKIEKELAEGEIFGLLPPKWSAELAYFTQNEFSSKIMRNGEATPKSSEEITARYNRDEFNPYDGEVVQAVDHLAAYLEAHQSRQHGITSSSIEEGLRYKTTYMARETVAGLRVGTIYADF